VELLQNRAAGRRRRPPRPSGPRRPERRWDRRDGGAEPRHPPTRGRPRPVRGPELAANRSGPWPRSPRAIAELVGAVEGGIAARGLGLAVTEEIRVVGGKGPRPSCTDYLTRRCWTWPPGPPGWRSHETPVRTSSDGDRAAIAFHV